MKSGDPPERRAEDPSTPEPAQAAEVASIRRQISVAVSRACPSWLRQEREDLVQSSLLRIVEAVGRAGGWSKVNATYVWRTATCAVLDEIRRARWRREQAVDKDPELRRAAHDGNPERLSAARELGGMVNDCLKTIAVSRRRSVQLHLVGYSHGEISERLGISVKQATNLVFRGMQDLRRCLRSRGVSA